MLSAAPTHWSLLDNTEKAVETLTSRIVTASESDLTVPDRRAQPRHPLPVLLTLTPIEEKTLEVTGDPLVVVGKQLSARGLDFYHCEPLTFRRGIISFDSFPALEANLVIRISWCRFLRPGWYDGGGRFTHVVMPADDIGAEHIR